MFSFKKTVEENKNEYLKSLEEVLDSGIGILGPKVKELESNLCDFTGAKFCVCNHSGTFSLSLALKALDIKEGDEVITTPFSWISSTSTIVHSGATPVFIDIEEDSYNINMDLIEESITQNTKCILIVNIFGKLINNIDKLLAIKKKYNLFIIEDSAQSFGAFNEDYMSCDGKIGDICCTSFYPTKPLCGFGDGGACFTNNEELYNKLKLLRNHGMNKYAKPEILGWNARMNEFQAAIIIINLKNLKKNTLERQKIAEFYNNNININCKKPILTKGHMNAQYSLCIEDRNRFINYLKKNNISYKIFYEQGIHDHDIFKKYKTKNLNICDKITKSILSIPCYNNMNFIEVEKIVNIINKYES